MGREQVFPSFTFQEKGKPDNRGQPEVEQVGAVAVRVLFKKPDARRRVTTRGIGRKLNLIGDAAPAHTWSRDRRDLREL